MKIFPAVLIAAVLPAVAAAPTALAQAPDNQPAYVVTYIEVTPSAEMKTVNLLRQVAATSRNETGNRRYDVLQHVERRNQFAILETWHDMKAIEAHGAGAAMKQFRETLGRMMGALYDDRRYRNLE